MTKPTVEENIPKKYKRWPQGRTGEKIHLKDEKDMGTQN